MRFNLRNPFHQLMLFVVLALMTVLIGACASTQKPVTTEDYLQEAKGQITGAYNSIADLKTGGQITQVQAQAALVRVQKVDKDVHDAEAAMRNGITVSNTTFTSAIALLAAISADLKAEQKGK